MLPSLSDIVSYRRLLFCMRNHFEPDFPIDPQLQFERLLDCGEVAHLLHLHPKTVERMAREGRLPAFKVGRRWLFRTTHIDQWVSSLVHSTVSTRIFDNSQTQERVSLGISLVGDTE